MARIVFRFAPFFKGDTKAAIQKWMDQNDLSGAVDGKGKLLCLDIADLPERARKVGLIAGLYYAIFPPRQGKRMSEVLTGRAFAKDNWLKDQAEGMHILLSATPRELSGKDPPAPLRCRYRLETESDFKWFRLIFRKFNGRKWRVVVDGARMTKTAAIQKCSGTDKVPITLLFEKR